jgi:hypothetical protein
MHVCYLFSMPFTMLGTTVGSKRPPSASVQADLVNTGTQNAYKRLEGLSGDI